MAIWNRRQWLATITTAGLGALGAATSET